ncbi:rod shape-determining protein MreC [Marinihelvus fidelis]|uniref:Cell shape-determining protein MreC n=1 Tax=Marinihelvus fidelis TaxID=2613842 RepID=A0A5N0T8D8_9GAMM|nr:rod shape-determining protein MreC [Marinihelvus fidelis]KAA9131021.1 rod shape-determining protein MreC [Marinihelvus fidelis]
MRIDNPDVNRGTGQGRLSTPRLMLYLLLSVLLMAMDQSGRFIPRIRAALDYAVEPVYLLAELPARALRGVAGYSRSWSRLAAENERLESQVLGQSAQMLQMAALVEENQRLRDLLRATEGRQLDFRFAELISVSLDPYAHQVVIDRGQVDGVSVGQAVIDGLGVMGQVESIQWGQSRVRLISDPEHALPVQILRTGQRTVAYGTGDPARLRLPNLPIQADVRPDDMLVTSGLGDRFPAGFPVAVISAIDRDTDGAFAMVEARPTAALDRGREVLLVIAPEATEDVQ